LPKVSRSKRVKRENLEFTNLRKGKLRASGGAPGKKRGVIRIGVDYGVEL